MKKIYYKPMIQIKSIEFEDVMENPISIPMYTNDEALIEDDSEILVNKHSIWDE